MRFADKAPLTGVHRTEDGYLTGSVKAARTGVQMYTRKELQLDGDGLIAVFRPPEAVFAEDSLRTYAGKPITLGHPKSGVNSDNWKDKAVGTVGNRVVRDGENVVIDFALMDAAAILAVENGSREVSMGYSTPIEMRNGITDTGEAYEAVQTGPLRINHLAVVPTARAGSEFRIGDSAEYWGPAPVNRNKETDMTTKVVVLGDAAVTVPLQDAAVIEAFRNTMTKMVADVKAEKTKMESEKDEEIGGLKAKKKALEDAAITPAKLSKLISDRVALENQVKLLDAGIVCDGVADDDLRKAAVVAKLGDSAVVDSSASEITGMFKALAHTDSRPDVMRDTFRGQRVNDSATHGLWNDSIAAAAGVSFKKKGA